MYLPITFKRFFFKYLNLENLIMTKGFTVTKIDL